MFKKKGVEYPIVIHFRLDSKRYSVLSQLANELKMSVSALLRDMLDFALITRYKEHISEVERKQIESQRKTEEFRRMMERREQIRKDIEEILKIASRIKEAILKDQKVSSLIKKDVEILESFFNTAPDEVKEEVNPIVSEVLELAKKYSGNKEKLQ